jgi:hypothetical protein
MNSDFSERQYETMVNIEVSAGLGSNIAPVVPSTPEEGETGWDALFKIEDGYWYFLQYKVVNLATRRSGGNQKFWDFHGGRYLRFELHSDSNGECRQHRLLTELRSTQPGVYYCVPAFVKEDELWERMGSGTLLEGSRMIDLAEVRLPDYNGTHHVSFDDGGLVQAWSDPGEPSIGDRSWEIRRRPENRRKMTKASVARLFADVSRIATASDRPRLGPPALDAWAEMRAPDGLAEVLPRILAAGDDGIAELEAAASGPELVALAAQALQMDLGLTWVVEPVD